MIIFCQGRDDDRGYFVRGVRANVSAVLACQQLRTFSDCTNDCVHHDPSAAHPFGYSPFDCDEARLQNGTLQHTTGTSFDELMGLSSIWQNA